MASTPNLARFDRACLFQRRADGSGVGGRGRGPWETIFETRCRLVPLQGGEQVQAGQAFDRMYCDLSIRDGAQGRTITAADRVQVEGVEYRIDAVIPADRTYRFIRFRVSIGLGG